MPHDYSSLEYFICDMLHPKKSEKKQYFMLFLKWSRRITAWMSHLFKWITLRNPLKFFVEIFKKNAVQKQHWFNTCFSKGYSFVEVHSIVSFYGNNHQCKNTQFNGHYTKKTSYQTTWTSLPLCRKIFEFT